jgi:two-component system, chemotaxis family, protein-glutamate methylesterase/glutaminase
LAFVFPRRFDSDTLELSRAAAMPRSRIVVMGASAGGVEAVSTVIAGLTPELQAAVLVVIHTGAGEDGLAAVLGRSAPVPVHPARDRTALVPGQVFVAKPDRHLAVEDGRMRVVAGPSEHGFRPAVDVLFLSAARAAGARAAGVILSGALSDGVAGLRAIKAAGGRAIVQRPDEAAFPSMPLNALRDVEVDAVLSVAEIGGDLVRWAARPVRRRPTRAAPRARRRPAYPSHGERLPTSTLVPVSCPSCSGSLAETTERGVKQYKCHVGHRFNPDSLVAGVDGQVEKVLWTAVRALQEKALLRRRMHTGAPSRTIATLSDRWLAEALECERQADAVRRLIEKVAPPGSVVIAERLAKQGGLRRRTGSRQSRSRAGQSRG